MKTQKLEKISNKFVKLDSENEITSIVCRFLAIASLLGLVFINIEHDYVTFGFYIAMIFSQMTMALIFIECTQVFVFIVTCSIPIILQQGIKILLKKS